MDMSEVSEKELEMMKSAKIYQAISHNYNVNQVITEWYGRFEELERSQVWAKMKPSEKAWVMQVESDRVKGVKRDVDHHTRAFDDFTVADNMGFIAQQLKALSSIKPPKSEKSHSSGGGHYDGNSS